MHLITPITKTAALLTAALMACAAQAEVVYTYTGQTFFSQSIVDSPLIPGSFTPNSSIISGSFTVATALDPNLSIQAIAPTSFSFSDSRFTYNEANALFKSNFLVRTDANGDITQWLVELQDIDPQQTSLDPFVITHQLVTRSYVFVQDAGRQYACAPDTVTVALCGVGYSLLANDQMFQQGRAGTWTSRIVTDPGPTEVPLPGTLELIAAAGVAALFVRRRRPGATPRSISGEARRISGTLA